MSWRRYDRSEPFLFGSVNQCLDHTTLSTEENVIFTFVTSEKHSPGRVVVPVSSGNCPSKITPLCLMCLACFLRDRGPSRVFKIADKIARTDPS